MDFQAQLKKYAKLIIRAGVNLQPGQELLVSANLEAAPLARLVTEEAYLAGAKEVVVVWNDERTARLRYEHAPMEIFSHFPEWKALLQNGIADRGGAVLSLDSSDPQAMAGIDPQKMSAQTLAAYKACKPFYDAMDFSKISWCIAGAAAPAWATHVYPDLSPEKATEKLWEAIFHAARVDTPDPIAAWKKHGESFHARRAFLNSRQFDRLQYHNCMGTDITIGLPKGHVWAGGAASIGEIDYFPNIPTEEIFCSPDRNRTQGTVHSAMPLNYRGTLIDDFSLTFHEGKVVDCTATKGLDALRSILETDKGACMLGECALIPKQSPISEMHTLFYSTLFDENAACHFALGKGFPECLEGGIGMNDEELLTRGVNDSAMHVDFMLGTPDLDITGYTAQGEAVPIFRDGGWAF